MKKLVLAAAVVATLVFVGVAGASAAPPVGGPPGQGECDHGNSQRSCRPDPQPSHGADCDPHGGHNGGVNEDHCSKATPPAQPTPKPTPTPRPTPTPETNPTPTPVVRPDPSTAGDPPTPAVPVPTIPSTDTE
jgi:hypothetical protein